MVSTLILHEEILSPWWTRRDRSASKKIGNIQTNYIVIRYLQFEITLTNIKAFNIKGKVLNYFQDKLFKGDGQRLLEILLLKIWKVFLNTMQKI